MLIIKLIDGRLRVVLTAAEKEYARMAEPQYEAIASFELAPGKVTQTLRASIAGRPAYTLTRTYTWDETFGVFIARTCSRPGTVAAARCDNFGGILSVHVALKPVVGPTDYCDIEVGRCEPGPAF